MFKPESPGLYHLDDASKPAAVKTADLQQALGVTLKVHVYATEHG